MHLAVIRISRRTQSLTAVIRPSCSFHLDSNDGIFFETLVAELRIFARYGYRFFTVPNYAIIDSQIDCNLSRVISFMGSESAINSQMTVVVSWIHYVYLH